MHETHILETKMLVCTLWGEGGGGLKKHTVCTLMKMLTLLDGPNMSCAILLYRIPHRLPGQQILWCLPAQIQIDIQGYIFIFTATFPACILHILGLTPLLSVTWPSLVTFFSQSDLLHIIYLLSHYKIVT